ncbi:hypothetical protein PUMCH_004580 [Australozyma saopauloensis]|uniref:Uncharacterized protein n=1 Tax=Australozyma saopauloensis TaxID=291208 RepID=A0AAX4HF10_9ASCO|nr:hypothetical protein PUMCH_004580 [[Candida] saopauloensis]
MLSMSVLSSFETAMTDTGRWWSNEPAETPAAKPAAALLWRLLLAARVLVLNATFCCAWSVASSCLSCSMCAFKSISMVSRLTRASLAAVSSSMLRCTSLLNSACSLVSSSIFNSAAWYSALMAANSRSNWAISTCWAAVEVAVRALASASRATRASVAADDWAKRSLNLLISAVKLLFSWIFPVKDCVSSITLFSNL